MKPIPFEFQLHEWLKANCPPIAGGIGVGDDAAVVPWSSPHVVMTTDLLCDGVHFLSASQPWEQIGRKALGVSLSDIAAMGARPVAATVQVNLPRSADGPSAQRLMQGVLDLAAKFNVSVVGGDTNRGGDALVIGTTVIGTLWGEPWRIDSANPGDRILVSGSLGGSLRGKHLSFMPRCDMARDLARWAPPSAATDISDSLTVDLANVCEASRCGALLDATRIPVAQDAIVRSRETGRSPLQHALEDGEDFELLIWMPADQWALAQNHPELCDLIEIGTATDQPGIRIRQPDGVIRDLDIAGYEH